MAAGHYIFSCNKGTLLYGNDVWLRNKIFTRVTGRLSVIYIVAHADIVVYSLHFLDSLWPYCFLGCVNHHHLVHGIKLCSGNQMIIDIVASSYFPLQPSLRVAVSGLSQGLATFSTAQVYTYLQLHIYSVSSTVQLVSWSESILTISEYTKQGIEDSEGWWLSGCHSLAADLEHWLRQARCPGFDSQ